MPSEIVIGWPTYPLEERPLTVAITGPLYDAIEDTKNFSLPESLLLENEPNDIPDSVDTPTSIPTYLPNGSFQEIETTFPNNDKSREPDGPLVVADEGSFFSSMIGSSSPLHPIHNSIRNKQ